jgi:hypothetical protein
MSEKKRQAFYRRTLLSIWAMVTLVLAFCVLLLFNEIARQGHDPLELIKQPAQTSGSQSAAAIPDTVDVPLYFADNWTSLLVSEERRFTRSKYTLENCREILKSLIAGPRRALHPILPSDTAVRALYLLDEGELVIDFSREVEQGLAKSASAEALMVHGIVNTLAQASVKGSAREEQRVRRIRFLFEGSTPQERFPRHLDLADPVEPDPAWIAPSGLAAAPHV